MSGKHYLQSMTPGLLAIFPAGKPVSAYASCMTIALRLAFLIFMALQLFAQGAGTAEVTVVDQSGGAIVNAIVSLTNIDNGLARKGLTNQEGTFLEER